MQTKLMNAGIRPHNNVVDITNFVLLEYGQPLHAFDYDRFGSKEVVVRKAAENETIVTLDEQERKLSSSHLVITNGKRRKQSRELWAEPSLKSVKTPPRFYWKPLISTDRPSAKRRDLGLRSEASARYEKALTRHAFCLQLNGPAASFRRMQAEKCCQARLKKTI